MNNEVIISKNIITHRVYDKSREFLPEYIATIILGTKKECEEFIEKNKNENYILVELSENDKNFYEKLQEKDYSIKPRTKISLIPFTKKKKYYYKIKL